MRWMDRMKMSARLVRRKRAGAELELELTSHLENEIAANRAAGMTAEQARSAAVCTVGNLALIRDQTHDTWGWSGLESWLRDLRLGIRTLSRTPGFTIIAILVMGL